MGNLIKKEDMKQLLSNRANLYRLLSRLYLQEVDEGFLKTLEGVSYSLVQEEGPLAQFGDALSRLKEYFQYDAGESVEDLAVDYAKTFLSAGIAQGGAAFPYESVYTNPKKVMMQEAWCEVLTIYEGKGIVRNSQSPDLVEDHISVELGFMAFLCDETSGFTEPLAGLEEQREFLNCHLLNWVPEFTMDIAQFADTEFYRMVAQLTSSFLQMDSYILDQTIISRTTRTIEPVGFTLSRGRMNEVLQALSTDYRIYAPSLVPDRGTWNENGLVRYQEVSSLEEMVLDRKSDFSMKEVVNPVSQTLFSFDENHSVEETDLDPKGIIVFVHPCDINGLRRLDNMFLSNGGFGDTYYKTLRDKVKIFMMECEGSRDNCYCVSMGTNKTEDYSVACNLYGENISLSVKDSEFLDYFQGDTKGDYTPKFVEENQVKVTLPKIQGDKQVNEIHKLPMWAEVSEDCISCGGCNTVCPTCSCFDTVDHRNTENSLKGERRRVWSSCMLPDYSKTAGGHVARPKAEQMMRFKTLHKVHDYNVRFGGNEHMCVGCGRCVHRCPKDISFVDTINLLSKEVEKLNAGESEVRL